MQTGDEILSIEGIDSGSFLELINHELRAGINDFVHPGKDQVKKRTVTAKITMRLHEPGVLQVKAEVLVNR
jgi:hypothetical protein